MNLEAMNHHCIDVVRQATGCGRAVCRDMLTLWDWHVPTAIEKLKKPEPEREPDPLTVAIERITVLEVQVENLCVSVQRLYDMINPPTWSKP